MLINSEDKFAALNILHVLGEYIKWNRRKQSKMSKSKGEMKL